MGKNTRTRILVLALAGIVLTGVGSARAAEIGANDDTGKFAADGGGAFFERMTALGLTQTVMTVRFLPDEPRTIQGREFLDRAIPEARRSGLKVVLAVYPYPPRSLTRTRAEVGAFADYVALVAREYPQVSQFVIGNEPNQPAFWRPQLSRAGVVLSAPAFGRYLAAAYDALKAVDPANTVIGVGLSPRGNDNPRARSNLSTSPVRFLSALGAWYRRSGRTEPLMDGLAFHLYPRTAKDALLRRYDWPNAGYADLDRVKQAFWDAFHDTAQPTTADGLRLYLNEAGWQVDTAGREGYEGLENVPVTTEKRQAAVYADLVRRISCDPDVAELNFFGFYDDASRGAGFQAALHRVDGTARPAALAVAGAIAKSKSRPCARPATWAPATRVSGAGMSSPRLQRSGAIRTLVGAKESARALVCLVPGDSASKRLVASASSLLARALTRCWRGTLTPRFRRSVKLEVPLALRGRVAVAAVVAAQANPTRTSAFAGVPTGP